MTTNRHDIQTLIAAQQGTPTFDAILEGYDWVMYISQERARRANPDAASRQAARIACQLAFLRQFTDEQLAFVAQGGNAAYRLDWIARELLIEQAHAEDAAETA
jgi:hypothetical protein